MSGKFFSLEWFKSKIEQSIEKVVASKVESLIETEQVEQEYVKPYKSLKLVNNVLTVVLEDGSVISKSEFPLERFYEIKNAKNLNELLILLKDEKFVEEIKEAKKIISKIEKLSKLKDFELVNNSLVFKQTSRSIPKLLVDKIFEIVEKYNDVEDINKKLKNDVEYQSLKRFFMWCCLNPRAEVADKLYEFLENNSFRITKQGFFVALRNVVTVKTENNKELIDLISNSYNKIKAVWRQTPEKYEVVKINNEYSIRKINKHVEHEGEVLGTLKEMYLNLPNMSENRYTDAHTKTFDIRIGQKVWMDPKDCNWSIADCAEAGLHFTSDEINYVGCGDTSVLVLINPMKVVGIGTSKGRCYEYFPIMTVPRKESTKILHDLEFDTLELDEIYVIDELESLEEKVKQGFVTEATKHNFNLPNISNLEIRKIVINLNEISTEIENRVINS